MTVVKQASQVIRGVKGYGSEDRGTRQGTA